MQINTSKFVYEATGAVRKKKEIMHYRGRYRIYYDYIIRPDLGTSPQLLQGN